MPSRYRGFLAAKFFSLKPLAGVFLYTRCHLVDHSEAAVYVDMMATPRGYWRALVDRLVGWTFGLPTESCGYTVTPVHIPLDDGIALAADLYQPLLLASTEPDGQLLVYSPYGRGPATSILNASLFAARGLQVLLVSCRGTYGSEGKMNPNRSEAADVQGVIRWMRKQTWYPGTFATIGASYLGYAQWAMLENPPEDLVACAISVGPHDYSQYVWGSGAFRLDRIFWSDSILLQEDKDVSAFQRVIKLLTTKRRLQPVFESVPLLEGIKSHFGDGAPWLKDLITHPDPSDEFYVPVNHSEALNKVQVPVFLTSGWYDTFLAQSMEQYARLRERGLDVELQVGPWTHVMASGLGNIGNIYKWIDEQLARRGTKQKKLPVRVFVGGVGKWRELPTWPPATEIETFYLQPSHRLSKDEPSADISPSTFVYEPTDPTPTVGGPLLTGGGRGRDDALAARSDVLVFTTDPLETGVEVMGKPSIKLYHSSDNPHTDIFVRLSEVDRKGRSYNITETLKRVNATTMSTPVKLEMLDCAHTFKEGTRIRLLIAGGSFPMYLRNFGTDESPGTATNMRPATHKIAHGMDGASALYLPISIY